MPTNRRGHDRAWNLTVWRTVFMILTFASMGQSLEVISDDDFAEGRVFNKRPQRFSFGLGKRSVNPSLPEDLDKVLQQIRIWDPPDVTTPNSLLKRSVGQTNSDLYSFLSQLRKWRNADGLEKRDVNELESLYNNLGKWGLSGPHGLFKREGTPKQEDSEEDTMDVSIEDFLPTGIEKRQHQFNFGLGKRGGQYAFGLGKRGGQYAFGLGKRGSQYGFGLGKRSGQYAFGLGKRGGQYAFGLGKRGGQYGYGLGKRDPYTYRLG